MAKSSITNGSGFPVTLPYPFRGVLSPGRGVVVALAVPDVLTMLGPVGASLRVAEANAASPVDDVLGVNFIADPVTIDADTSIAALAQYPTVEFAPTATRTIDVTNAPSSVRLDVVKTTRAGFGIMLSVAADPTYTTPAGLGQNYLLQSSAETLTGYWILQINKPSKIVEVFFADGSGVISVPAPSPLPPDSLSIAAGGDFSRALAAYSQTAALTAVSGLTLVGTGLRRAAENRGDAVGASLLYEGISTNLLLRSQEFDNAVWLKTGVVVGANADTAPDGTVTADSLTFAAAAGNQIEQPFTLAAGRFSGTFYLRSAGAENLRLVVLLKDGTESAPIAVVTGPLWARFEITIPDILNDSLATGTPRLILRNGADGLGRVVSAWAGMGEGGNFIGGPSSYIPTVAATVTRPADLLSYIGTARPASFGTRGVKVSFTPDWSSQEALLAGCQAALVTIDNDPTVGFGRSALGSARDVMLLSFLNDAQIGQRIVIQATLRDLASPFEGSGYKATNGNPLQGIGYTPLLTWARGETLTFEAQAYRGAVKVTGGSGPGANKTWIMGGGSWRWPSARLYVGNFLGATAINTIPGRYALTLESV